MTSSPIPAVSLNLDVAVRQCRFAPLRMGEERALLVVHSDCASIDPWHKAFTIPTDTVKLTAFSLAGARLWQRDLGPGMVPGMWFVPVFPFDLDGDGIDEIYLVNNADPAHPLNHEAFVLEWVSAATGEVLGSMPWPRMPRQDTIAHTYRYMINGGRSQSRRRLVIAQGTYTDLQFRCFDESLGEAWARCIDREEPGCRGSHMWPVVDIDGDGRDELLYGERCMDIDTGRDIWVGDEKGWWGHSDIVQPVRVADGWCVYTCRETPHPPEARGVVMFDGKGRELWGYRGMGHVHDGWTARLGDDGSHLCFSSELESRGAERVPGREHLYDMQGRPVDIPFPLTGTLPVDFNGDGRHEIMSYQADERHGRVVDWRGGEVARLDGRPVIGAKVLDAPGEQIITWSPEGVVRIYVCGGAEDSAAAKQRYADPFYAACTRLWSVGYNWRNLGGL